MRYFIFFIFTLIFSTSYACENANEIDVTKQCSFKYNKSATGNLLNVITIGITQNQVITAGGAEDGSKYLAVSADLKLQDGSIKKLSGNLPDTMIRDGSLMTSGTAIVQKIDDKTRDAQGENPEIVNCTIYF